MHRFFHCSLPHILPSTVCSDTTGDGDVKGLPGDCTDIYLSGAGEHCPCSGSIEAAVLDFFGYFAAVHMMEDYAHCSDMDMGMCHEMSDSSDCDLAVTSAVEEIGFKCFGETSDGAGQPTGYTDTTYVSEGLPFVFVWYVILILHPAV
jgi:hypothetical protein